MPPENLALIFGLSSAAAWGAGDFSGGLATKQSPGLTVLFVSQLTGGLLLAALAVLLSDPMPSRALLMSGALAGIFGMLGLACLYRGLARGRMGIVAPLSAVIAALVPVGFAFFDEGAPGVLQIAGFAVALAAVWCLTFSENDGGIKRQEILLALAAGGGFGIFFILIGQAGRESILWPLVAARLASLTLIGAMLIYTGHPPLPKRHRLATIVLAGVLDAAGNAFFALAARMGRLDVAAVVSSLYPLFTVVLARFVLQERLQRRQWAGVMAAVTALLLVAV